MAKKVPVRRPPHFPAPARHGDVTCPITSLFPGQLLRHPLQSVENVDDDDHRLASLAVVGRHFGSTLRRAVWLQKSVEHREGHRRQEFFHAGWLAAPSVLLPFSLLHGLCRRPLISAAVGWLSGVDSYRPKRLQRPRGSWCFAQAPVYLLNGLFLRIRRVLAQPPLRPTLLVGLYSRLRRSQLSPIVCSVYTRFPSSPTTHRSFTAPFFFGPSFLSPFHSRSLIASKALPPIPTPN
ncbi:hypothetical protein P170DRAFT_36465 [Aspergillus steynii IBT 23096]|uniref:Uncharacterized protein n=1 Tax=Aspergillus steynii IBT 23096 TaxID=1392250 RepID=A0A2I2GQU8_9EURO|nr:uncharacterized protein P170DRAFT_36465 [Aspergillus steynii IBT 23096]PLB55256.1 hypothetical protein P170DRAFT_36465 [Aspergillus steynii IBT 23096]